MDRTVYSADLPGAFENHGLTVRFDKTRGTIGISQWDPEAGHKTDRVLLSKAQVKELKKFLGSKVNRGGKS
jgi:hypothetical protein